ncbi:uncharacterized protein LOC124326633 [Daphnia pulicaria]|jgi:hypothetical protein|uniref:uncharacterized protein LOC124326633 n=1 Tax=Daphnia pulicaria TaxID=35523 RepID=UPI001EEC705F|nr:uncharacterized protein LOC124326633 [Daphnia pulicaria]
MGQICGAHSNSPDYSITNVANGYHKTIWVKVVAERKYVTLRDSSIENTAGLGFTPIFPGDFDTFRLPANQDPDDPVYITILTSDNAILYNSVPQNENQSLIVDKNGWLKYALSGFIWRDTNNQDHDINSTSSTCPIQ